MGRSTPPAALECGSWKQWPSARAAAGVRSSCRRWRSRWMHPPWCRMPTPATPVPSEPTAEAIDDCKDLSLHSQASRCRHCSHAGLPRPLHRRLMCVPSSTPGERPAISSRCNRHHRDRDISYFLFWTLPMSITALAVPLSTPSQRRSGTRIQPGAAPPLLDCDSVTCPAPDRRNTRQHAWLPFSFMRTIHPRR